MLFLKSQKPTRMLLLLLHIRMRYNILAER